MQKYKNNNLSKRIIIVSGPPGVGKTATIKQLCLKLPRVAHIQVDKLRKFIRAGYASPDNWTKATEQQYRLAYRNTLVLIKNFFEKNYLVFVDDVFQNRWKCYFRHYLREYRVCFIFLLSDLKTVLERNKLRGEFAVKESVIRRLYKRLVKENTEKRGWVIVKNGRLSIQKTAREILKVVIS
jgi:tRNA uridine 5-carbamoylmethylation protein Kti12